MASADTKPCIDCEAPLPLERSFVRCQGCVERNMTALYAAAELEWPMPKQPRWDETFLDESMDVVREMVDEAIESRRKVFEETYTMHSLVGPVETITITVKRERPGK